MLDKQHEDCGIVAVRRSNGTAAELVHRGLFALQHRGQEAAGISTYSGATDLHHLKGRGLVADALPVYRTKDLPGNMGVGHVRYSTVSADRSENIQPFIAATPYGRLAIAHNGNLKNADSLRARIEADGALMSTSMDTELFVHLIARAKQPTFEDALRSMAKEVVGAYSLCLLLDGRVFGLRDPHGIRPLVLGKRPDGYVLASETCALEAMGATFVREVVPGELVELTAGEPKAVQLLQPAAKPAPCIFELVYFARPDSTVFGQSVHGARTRMGEMLARQDAEEKLPKADIVVPIPDSGFPAAIGYARLSGVPLEKAIIRSHYVGRTFILPDHDSRAHALKLKLSVIRDAVAGKRVLLVDDSIVRGNTSRMIVQMVRDAGAKEVWMRIASPPLSWPCYLGIDTPTREELVINQKGSVDKVAEFIGTENLRYLSIGNLAAATQKQAFCMACMDGAYPV